jgi:DNA primase
MTIKFLFLPDGEDPDSLVKKEGKLKFEERIKNATNLSEFLFSHLKGDDFKSVEGKTKFMQKAGKLIELVGYSVYKEQLIQGLSTEVNQNIESVKKHIQPTKYREIVEPKKTAVIPKINAKDNFKNQLGKIITMVLKHPSLGTDALMTEMKKISNTEVLQKIIDLTSFDEGKKTHAIIESFKNNMKVYNRLWFLVKNSPKLTELEAEKELETALKAIKALDRKIKNQQEIANANDFSSARQQEIIDNIKSSKTKFKK